MTSRILAEELTVPGDSTGESPVYSSWATVRNAAEVDGGVTVTNNYAPDIWIQWADDRDDPNPEDVDVFLVGTDPGSNGQLYYVEFNGLPPAGAYVRVKIIAWDMEAACQVHIDVR